MVNKEDKNKRLRELQIKGNKYKSELIRKATKEELIFKEALIDCGIMFSFQKVFYTTERVVILDFYLKTKTGRYNIEIDGAHHFTKKGKEYDLKRSKWLFKNRKVKTIRFTNSEIRDDLNRCVHTVLGLNPRFIKI